MASAKHTAEEASDGVQLKILSREVAAVDGSTLPPFVAVSFTGCGGVLINNRSSLKSKITKSFQITAVNNRCGTTSFLGSPLADQGIIG